MGNIILFIYSWEPKYFCFVNNCKFNEKVFNLLILPKAKEKELLAVIIMILSNGYC